MRLAASIGPGRDDADALPFEHRKARAAQIENDVADIRIGIWRGKAVIALHRGF